MKNSLTYHSATGKNEKPPAQQHDNRNKAVTATQEHIKEDGLHETLVHIPIPEAYDKYFGDAVKAYNEKQVKTKHADRQIKNYYNKVYNEFTEYNKKHYGKMGYHPKKVAYEKIIQVGDRDNPIAFEDLKSIMQDYLDWHEKRYPHVQIIGCYIHADEEGGPHAHIIELPIGEGYKQGPALQPGLDKALEADGYKEIKPLHDGERKITRQEQYTADNRARLKEICLQHGIEIEDLPKEQKAHEHLDTAEYKKARDEFTQLKEENQRVQEAIDQGRQEARYKVAAIEDDKTFLGKSKNTKTLPSEVAEVAIEQHDYKEKFIESDRLNKELAKENERLQKDLDNNQANLESQIALTQENSLKDQVIIELAQQFHCEESIMKAANALGWTNIVEQLQDKRKASKERSQATVR